MKSVAALQQAVVDRLMTAADALGVDTTNVTPGGLVQLLAARIVRSRRPDEAWLLYIALSGAFPTPQQLDNFRNLVELSTTSTAMLAVLEGALDSASSRHVIERKMVIESDRVVIDANFCATEEHNTGIQRVVRETLPKWAGQDRPIHIVAWTPESTGMREVDKYELDRVLSWNDRRFPIGHRHPREGDGFVETLVVPWKTDVFLPEVPLPSTMAPLACLAESSGNVVTLIGHDAIPLVSADGQPNAESERFAHFLTVVKYAAKVIGVSRSAASEFRGFASAVPAQGLPGPAVASVSLAGEVPARARSIARQATAATIPLVLCVGSHEPRKNQEAVLFAAEYLFTEGHRFRLVFVGRGSRAVTQDFDRRARRLRRKGLDVQSLRSLDDDDLWKLYSEARFTAFVSLHEGFGLPVVESLALGTPVLTSNFGSLAEIAALGGCLTVDPRDDEQIIEGMRRMLEDDELITRLATEADAASTRTWEDYARELWSTAGFRTGVEA